MIRIAVDCRFASTQSGLGRYTREIAANLVKESHGEVYVLLVRSKEEQWLKNLPNKHCEIVVVDIPHYSFAEHFKLPRIVRSAKANLLFSPHFNIPFFSSVPTVITIHDLILHRYPNNASLFKRFAYRLLIKRAVSSARSIIAISDFVKQELAQTYGDHVSQKTMTVLEGVDERFHPQDSENINVMKKKYQLDKKYFLYVGNAKQHKNVRTLLKGFESSGVRHCELILVTSGPETKSLLPLPSGCRFLHPVPDEDLPALYAGAEALVTASLYEGFCLPVAEALACGTPVIASDRTAIPQIASGHALLVEPTIEEFAKAFGMSLPRPKPFVIGNWSQTARVTRTIVLEALV